MSIEEKRALLEAKKAANIAKEATQTNEEAALDREIAIEDARTEAYATGLVEEQLVEMEFPGVGRCLFRTPHDLDYRDWAKKSGVAKADLTGDMAVHDVLASKCLLVPVWKDFSKLSKERCPSAPLQIASALSERMKGKTEAAGK
jgi:hypothetical protein